MPLVLVVVIRTKEISKPIYVGHDMINRSFLSILLEAIWTIKGLSHSAYSNVNIW